MNITLNIAESTIAQYNPSIALKTLNSTKENQFWEIGYKIKLFQVNKKDFIDFWNEIKLNYDLKCAFIKIKDEYCGCISNWLENKCPNKN